MFIFLVVAFATSISTFVPPFESKVTALFVVKPNHKSSPDLQSCSSIIYDFCILSVGVFKNFESLPPVKLSVPISGTFSPNSSTSNVGIFWKLPLLILPRRVILIVASNNSLELKFLLPFIVAKAGNTAPVNRDVSKVLLASIVVNIGNSLLNTYADVYAESPVIELRTGNLILLSEADSNALTPVILLIFVNSVPSNTAFINH